MRKRLLVLASAVSLSCGWAGGSSAGGFISGSQLLEDCTAEVKAYCISYVMGVADSFDCDDPLSGYRWQAPQVGLKTSQVVRVVTKFLDEHPEKLHLLASSLVANALEQAFPCP